jgi:glutamyl-tRNA(Gln) amidotransferase subunit E
LISYQKIGLKVGLEVHQELSTEHKMFCKCPPLLFSGEPDYTFIRRLRPSQSELGKVDPAALFESIKGKTMVYEANSETSCLVEMDEEPPSPLNEEAIDICLTFALMTDSKPVDEIHVMRKIVVDGSNTTGFQRTCVVSLGGLIDVEGNQYRLQHIGLEEDAARKVSENGRVTRYRIDRLGIPLIEVTTAPDIHSPKEAEDVALAIGRILRATGKVRRGLGSIRQDVNISIVGGALIEIKGVQELGLVSKVVEYEVQRQVKLIELVSELKKRMVTRDDLQEEIVDVSEVFEKTKSHIIRNALKKGGRVLAIKLPKFSGVLGFELCPNRRLGTEMADHAKYHAGVKGIFHTDELPANRITDEEVSALKKAVLATNADAVVIVADELEKCRQALNAVFQRALMTIDGVPRETRSADPDGTTHFTRPRPGAARMYPETDIVSTVITKERLDRLQSILPEMPDKRLERLQRYYGINEKLARQINDSEYIGVFERVTESMKVDPTLLAVTLTETFKSLERDGVQVLNLGDEAIKGVFSLIVSGKTVKESLPEIFTWLAENTGKYPEEALKALRLEMFTQKELKGIAEAKVRTNKEIVERMGYRAMGPLMGIVMSEVRGRADTRDVQKLLRELLSAHVKE